MIDYKDTNYTQLIRITKEDKEFIRKAKKPKQSLAGKLKEIIRFYEKQNQGEY